MKAPQGFCAGCLKPTGKKKWCADCRRPNKFHAQETSAQIEGVIQRYRSRKEARRHAELLLLEKTGAIQNVRREVPYDIIINGAKVCTYVADFVYLENGAEVVEDAKSPPTRTPVYRLKKKLLQALYGIHIKEV